MGKIKSKFKALVPIIVAGLFLTACESECKSLEKEPEEKNSISSEYINVVDEAASTFGNEKEDTGIKSTAKDEIESVRNETGVKETGEDGHEIEGEDQSEQNGESSFEYKPGTSEEGQSKPGSNKERILEDFIICIDAGHGITDLKKQEPIAPGSDITKPAFVPGTRGANQTEEQLNLKVAKKLEQRLIELGADVHMTRTEARCDMSNIDRAEFANGLNADIFIRIHADGNQDKSVHGISMLVPANDYINDEELVEKSMRAGKLILDEVIKQTGAKKRGVIKRSDLTGFNWSKVPVVLLEMGFMTNPDEDKLLETEEYQDKIVQGIVNGLISYFKN
ncbi:MAG TPA: N-acetylmuramoyl-L-alanine amidase [Clostridiaceae bacterium]|nr:N-acetylmuramoyl-L-alanine amidase [Clostridiaceae bacterium]